MSNDASMYRFDDFRLDVANRRLTRADARLDLNGRYFDALVLLVREGGRLVEKDQFFKEVWGDVVVSDSALTQCIKEIRKQLGDEAGNPRYIETVPRHGYRFVAAVKYEPTGDAAGGAPNTETGPLRGFASDTREHAPSPEKMRQQRLQRRVREALALLASGTIGGAAAGVLGGLIYGFGLAYNPSADPRLGIASVVLVLLSLNVVIGAVGALGICSGMAVARLIAAPHSMWTFAGAAVGGLLVGGLSKLLGLDAFTLLFGRAPAGITGGFEGAALGASIALGAQLGGGVNAERPWRPIVGAAVAGAVTGALIPLLGGRLMGGSLELLAGSFADSQLRLEGLGRFVGEVQFGAATQVVLACMEGMIFASCVAAAIVLARRYHDQNAPPTVGELTHTQRL